MPRLSELYKQLQVSILGSLAHPLRGQITVVNSGDSSKVQWFKGKQFVDIIVTPSGASYPRTYKNVPWPFDSLSSNFGPNVPKQGEFVDLTFKGGSSEFPVITAVYAGPATQADKALANVDWAKVPTIALVSTATKPVLAAPAVGGNQNAASLTALVFSNK